MSTPNSPVQSHAPRDPIDPIDPIDPVRATSHPNPIRADNGLDGLGDEPDELDEPYTMPLPLPPAVPSKSQPNTKQRARQPEPTLSIKDMKKLARQIAQSGQMENNTLPPRDRLREKLKKMKAGRKG